MDYKARSAVPLGAVFSESGPTRAAGAKSLPRDPATGTVLQGSQTKRLHSGDSALC